MQVGYPKKELFSNENKRIANEAGRREAVFMHPVVEVRTLFAFFDAERPEAAGGAIAARIVASSDGVARQKSSGRQPSSSKDGWDPNRWRH